MAAESATGSSRATAMASGTVRDVGITIRTTRPAREEWDAYLRSHPRAAFCHLSAWHEAVEGTFGYEPLHLAAYRDERICGVLPMCRVPTLPFGSALVSSPMAVYGGACADDGNVADALLEKAKEKARQRAVKFLELRNQEPHGDLPAKNLYVTFRREIFQSEEENMAAIPLLES